MSASTSKTQYARAGDVHIAYQVLGEGPLDLIFIPGWVSHVEQVWEVNAIAAFLRRLASFSRLILIDRRGTGLSDPVINMPTLEERVDEIRAVMDAAGSFRAALFGISEGGPLCSLFASAQPGRTEALVLYGTFARGTAAPDYPDRPTQEQMAEFAKHVGMHWGRGTISGSLCDTVRRDPLLTEQWGRLERMSASPGSARRMIEMLAEVDIRSVLPMIRRPTLVISRQGDPVTRVDAIKTMASMIPGARYVELEGNDHFPFFGDVDSIIGEVQQFLTGKREAPEPTRLLSTVLFVDIVGSTDRASRLGDGPWSALLQRFTDVAARTVLGQRGDLIKSTGDGFLASFDGPARGVRAALAMREAARGLDIDIRAGLHTGECMALPNDLGGIAVHLAARVSGVAEAGEILVSRTVKDLVAGSGLRFTDCGSPTLKGIAESWQIFRLEA